MKYILEYNVTLQYLLMIEGSVRAGGWEEELFDYVHPGRQIPFFINDN